MAAPVPRLSATPGKVRHAGHRVGQDTRRVLVELLGMAQEEVDRLEAAGVIACGRGGDDRGEAVNERAGAA